MKATHDPWTKARPGHPVRRRLAVGGLILSLASGCQTFEASREISLSIPPAYSASGAGGKRMATGWLSDLDDRRLVPLVDEAMKYNSDLAASAARLRSARANVGVTNAARYPQVSLDGGGTRRKSVSDGVDETGVADLIDSYTNSYNIGANLSWEIDLWGRLRNRTRAAVADYQAAAADHHGFILSLAANVARSWYNAAEAELQTELGRDTVDSLQKNLNFVERGVRLGTSEVLDLRLTEANLEAAKSNLEARLRQRDEAARSLEVLLGRYPSNQIAVRNDLPGLRRPVPSGLPSELLLRRPDLIASERRLSASVERVSESQKEFLPNISLTGSAGTGTAELRRLLDAERLAWSIAANAVQPIFQGGRLSANLERAQAQYDEALAQFTDTALEAFREVETALAAEGFLLRQVAAQERAVAQSVAAEDLAWEQYSNGLVDGLTWLEAQRRSFNSKSTLLQLKNLRLQNRIDLYLALGGDFKTRPASAPRTANVR